MNSPGGKTATCTVKLSGGLGNQLFQYAAGRALSLRTGSQLSLDATFYQRKRKRHRCLDLQRFPVQGKFVYPQPLVAAVTRLASTFAWHAEKRPTYREPHPQFDRAFERLEAPVTIVGYFQSERYFQDYAEIIRDELAIPRPADPEILRTGQQMAESMATSLHIRRGDYVSDAKASAIYAECTLEYYHQAMERIAGNAPVHVFSDDLAWAKENLREVKPLVFPHSTSAPSALDDLWLMSQANQHIIANSTFSWWGAWLAGKNKGLTIAPAQWFKDPSVVDIDLVPEQWIRL